MKQGIDKSIGCERAEDNNMLLNGIANIDKVIHEPARLMIMSLLYVVESADYVFLMRQTGMTWGNLSSHISKLEGAGYVGVKKEFLGKKPHTTLMLTGEGRSSFKKYQDSMKGMLKGLDNI